MTHTTEQSLDAALQTLIAQNPPPIATYRLQMSEHFGFHHARDLVPYLRALGISHCYLSPILMPRSGSSHGYDVANHSQLNPVLGTREDFDALCATLRAHAMGLILDVVPNHMGIDDPRNVWWNDVLENGPASLHAHYFDIEWHPVKQVLANKVLLPVLGDQYGNVLERGELQLRYEHGRFNLYYYDHTFPIAPCTYHLVLAHRLDALLAELGEDDLDMLELQSILTAIYNLPARTTENPDERAERNREKEIIKRRLDQLTSSNPIILQAITDTLRLFNGNPDDRTSYDPLHALIEQQSYRLAFWRVAAEEINYRRFFDINELAALRVEDPDVFEASHALIFDLLHDMPRCGLRIDHPDGLWNPPVYFLNLQVAFAASRLHAHYPDDSPAELHARITAWLEQHMAHHGATAPLPLYVVAEKILAEHEPLPTDWTVHGTTGYDFLNDTNGVLVDRQHQRAFTSLYHSFIKEKPSYPMLVNNAKKRIMNISLASEIYELSYRLERIVETNRNYRDFTLNSLTLAIREIVACMSVYRTYVTEDGKMSERDQSYIKQAVREASRRNPSLPRSVISFMRDTLTLRNLHEFAPDQQDVLINFVMRLQQLTSPVMAKGLEDTTFYVYNRLISLNEVGGHPDHFGLDLDAYHQRNQHRQQRWNATMLTLSTHDTKRSGDVRARLNVLSEVPTLWRERLQRYARLNATRKMGNEDNAEPVPDRNDEYLLYQTLLGVWNDEQPGKPAFATLRERVTAYMEKAIKEAKVHTNWLNPNEEYEAAMHHFLQSILDDRGKNRKNNFLVEMGSFRQHIAFYGYLNSLVQTVLLLTTPGVPDIYQGTEMIDFSLVDPDNRRPVDYQHRRTQLEALQQRIRHDQPNLIPMVRELLDHPGDGTAKLYILMQILQMRRHHAELFWLGNYVRLDTTGTRAQHVIAFARSYNGTHAVVVVPRWIVDLTENREQMPHGALWQNTALTLPAAELHQPLTNLLTGETLTPTANQHYAELPLAAILRHFPVAVLITTPPEPKESV